MALFELCHDDPELLAELVYLDELDAWLESWVALNESDADPEADGGVR
jgi:hypothetical protein